MKNKTLQRKQNQPLLRCLAAVVVTILLLSGCDRVFSQERTVCASGYNEFDRQIYEFWLDGENKSGCFGNPPGKSLDQNFGGGGKFACGCTVTPGKKVNLYWSFEQTRDEYDSGKKPEEHTKQVIIPRPESSSSRYLRVYFMKDGTTPIQWVDEMGAPELAPTQGRKSDAKKGGRSKLLFQAEINSGPLLR
ncbi:MAG: hypothetical protein QM581_16965 [Pseudomonas sp.]